MKRNIFVTILLWVIVFFLFPSTVLANSDDPQEENQRVFIVSNVDTTKKMDDIKNQIELCESHILITFPMQGFIVDASSSGIDCLEKISNTKVMNEIDKKSILQQGSEEKVNSAAFAWASYDPKNAIDLLTKPDPLKPDAFFPPIVSEDLNETKNLPSSYQTSLFMSGKVQVDVFVVESNGTLDGNYENWTSSMVNQVTSEVTAGILWWIDTAAKSGQPGANLSFNLVFHTPFNDAATVSTKYEPIRRPHTDNRLFVEEIMGRLGYTSDHWIAVKNFDHDRRQQYSQDWAFSVFVVNSLNDSDGKFTDDYFGYAYLYGPYVMMTYDNDNWGISNMEIVMAHEMGHIFGALDEYASSGCTDTERSGYLSVQNTNCENGTPATQDSIMRSYNSQFIAYPNHLASTPVRGMVGFRDGDGDRIYDPRDTGVSLSITSTPASLISENTVSYQGSVTDIPFPSPTMSDVSINTITSVQYQIDSASWVNCSANDGIFNQFQENFTCQVTNLPDGLHTIKIRGLNRIGNSSTIYSHQIINDQSPPTNPNNISVTNCAIEQETWQNHCNSPQFSWSGAADSLTEVAGYRIYWGSNPTGESNYWTTSLNHTPGVITSGSYFLRVQTKDIMGNWSEWDDLFSLYYDSEKPTGSFTINNQSPSVFMRSVDLSIEAVDQLSGVSQFRIRNQNQDWSSWINFENTQEWSLPAVKNQPLAVEMQISDKAGNLSSVFQSSTILKIDQENPQSKQYYLVRSTIGGSGSLSLSDNYKIQGSNTQISIVGSSESSSYEIASGYWSWWFNFMKIYLPTIIN